MDSRSKQTPVNSYSPSNLFAQCPKQQCWSKQFSQFTAQYSGNCTVYVEVMCECFYVQVYVCKNGWINYLANY